MDTPQRQTVKGSDLLVAALENEGVDRIFGIPGEENLDVVESIRKSSIQLVITRHEQAAAFMAATYGRLTGKPGVCIATLGPGALNLLDRRGLRAARRHADDHDHRPEGHPVVAAGAVPDRRRRRGDEAADQAVAPDRLAGDDSDAGARRLPRRGGGAAGSGPSGTSGRHRPRNVRAGADGPAASRRAALGERGRPRSRGRDDPEGRASVAHAGRGGIAAALDLGPRPVRAADANSLFHDADGQGHRAGRHRSLHGHRRALRARLRSRGDRARRPHHHDRPRYGREAAFHHGRERAERHPCRLPAGACRTGLLPASRGRRRSWPLAAAPGRPDRRQDPARAGAAAAARRHPEPDRRPRHRGPA